MTFSFPFTSSFLFLPTHFLFFFPSHLLPFHFLSFCVFPSSSIVLFLFFCLSLSRPSLSSDLSPGDAVRPHVLHHLSVQSQRLRGQTVHRQRFRERVSPKRDEPSQNRKPPRSRLCLSSGCRRFQGDVSVGRQRRAMYRVHQAGLRPHGDSGKPGPPCSEARRRSHPNEGRTC